MAEKGIISKERESRWAWIWFAYTGFLFIDPLFEPSRLLWGGTLAVFLLFIGIMWAYIRLTDCGSPFRYAMIAATLLLGLAAFPWNQGASCLFVFAASFVPYAVTSVRRVLALMLAEMAIVLAEGYIFTAYASPHSFFHTGWPNTIIAIFLMIIVGGSNIFFAAQRRADRQLRAAQEENVALAAVAERERIARDLHDVLGHTLSVIVLKAELAGRLVERDPARARAEIADVERTARTALAEVREAIGGYRARGLAAEIENARRALDAAGVALIADAASEGNAALSANEETVLALAVREAVTNIVRHARATTCTLRFVASGGRRRLIVEDDGQHSATREGNGLRGMRERVEALGGRLLLEREHGTRLMIELPEAAS